MTFRDGLFFETFMWMLTSLPVSGAFIAFGAYMKFLAVDKHSEPDRYAFYRDLFAWCLLVQLVWLWVIAEVFL